MSHLLAGKVVVVSGIGPGLGRSIAVQSARNGADVVLAARTESRLTEVADEVRALGRRALTVPTDIDDDASCANLLDASLAEFGHVDTLVNNAFRIPPMSVLQTVDLDATRAGFETNVLGALRLSRLFRSALTDSQGSIVMINSSVLRHANAPYVAYKMAKSALLALAQALASEFGPDGVRVNTVAPGYIWADMLQSYFDYLANKRGVDRQAIYDETAATMDLRRLPEPDQIADAVVFLASSMAIAITGQCLDVNCGEFHH